MKEIDIRTLELHDATIIDIHISSLHSNFDEIKITLESEPFLRDFGKSSICLIFKDIFGLKSNLHMWITGHDSIRKFDVLNDSEYIEEERKKLLNGFGPKEMKHLRLHLNSGSTIEMLLTKPVMIDIL